MDICWICDNLDGTTSSGSRDFNYLSFKILKGATTMPILFAVAGSALGCFAEGAILGASVYLVSRGVRNPLKNKK